MNKIFLDNWTLQESYPYVWYTYKKLRNVVGQTCLPIKAKVPGSVYGDLIRAGQIKHPYFADENKKCEWVSSRWWCYTTEINSSSFESESSIKYLIFKGIDNLSSVWLNGELIARFDGANNPQRIELKKLQSKNELRVIIESEPMENGQFVHTSKVESVRCRCGYRWDFCRRLINVGIYGEVYIEEVADAYIDNIQIVSAINNNIAQIDLRVSSVTLCKGFNGNVKVTVTDGEKVIFTKEDSHGFYFGEEKFSIPFNLDNIKLWYPNGYGEQPLYTFNVSIFKGDKLLYTKESLYGFRNVELLYNTGASPDMKKFLFEINGKKIYIKGFNYVPIDLMYGEEEDGKLEKLLNLAKECNCNLIRVWGGGYIASDKFYEICSRLGLLVWQDFLQSSSGMDNIPNHSKEFQEKLALVSKKAVIAKRNYPCLVVWNGGNELCADLNFTTLTDRDENSLILSGIVNSEDNGRIFFPTSPYGGNYSLDLAKGTNQNIHGTYKYYYGEMNLFHNKYYNSSNSLFHAEFGVDGLSDIKTLRQILPKKDLTVTDSLRNDMWVNVSNWWNTLDRDEHYFGEIKSLDDYVFVSQFMQAEGLRYIVECNRRRAFYNSGSVVWQLNEPTPNASCTTVVDYYLRPKKAYYALKKAFQPVLGCVKYEKLDFNLGEDIDLEFYAVNDTDRNGKLNIKITDDSGHVLLNDRVSFSVKNGYAEKLFSTKIKNNFESGIRIDMNCGRYKNTVLILSRGSRGYCDIEYVKKQRLWLK